MSQEKRNETKTTTTRKYTEGAWKWGLGRAKVTKAAWESMNCLPRIARASLYFLASIKRATSLVWWSLYVMSMCCAVLCVRACAMRVVSCAPYDV